MNEPSRPPASVGLDEPALAAFGVDASVISERLRLDGDRALEFLAVLPALLDEWQARLALRGATLLPGGVLSAAFACWRGEEPVVLKLSSAHATSARAEASALAVWSGRGACRLRFASPDARVMLLDRVRPGDAVRAGDEREDARRAADLMARLHRMGPVPREVPDAAEELRWRFERARRHLEGPSLARGLVSFDELASALRSALSLHASRPRTVLCHGDFLDKNLLVDTEGAWWAIDPRPCRGDPALDAAFWALAHREGEGSVPRAALVASEAGLPSERVLAWMRAFAASEAVLALDLPRARAFHAVLSRSTSLPMR